MIQRIQSIFLLIVVLCGAAYIFVVQYNENALSDDEMFYSCSILLNFISILLAVINIFLYKNRKLQMRLCSLLIVLNAFLVLFIPLLVHYYIINQLWTICFPLISTLSSFLARIYIKKDEELVRSSDRIR